MKVTVAAERVTGAAVVVVLLLVVTPQADPASAAVSASAPMRMVSSESLLARSKPQSDVCEDVTAAIHADMTLWTQVSQVKAVLAFEGV
jgi:hypothetical protein